MTETQKLELSQLNRMPAAEFVGALGGVFEHSSWVTEAVCSLRPFDHVNDLLEAMTNAVMRAAPEKRLELLRAHPELAGRMARGGELTRDSRAEQGSAGLNTLSEEEYQRFASLNRAYREKFGFPFLIAVKEHSKDEILAQFEIRLQNSRHVEIENALAQIFRIVKLRLQRLLADSPP